MNRALRYSALVGLISVVAACPASAEDVRNSETLASLVAFGGSGLRGVAIRDIVGISVEMVDRNYLPIVCAGCDEPLPIRPRGQKVTFDASTPGFGALAAELTADIDPLARLSFKLFTTDGRILGGGALGINFLGSPLYGRTLHAVTVRAEVDLGEIPSQSDLQMMIRFVVDVVGVPSERGECSHLELDGVVGHRNYELKGDVALTIGTERHSAFALSQIVAAMGYTVGAEKTRHVLNFSTFNVNGVGAFRTVEDAVATAVVTTEEIPDDFSGVARIGSGTGAYERSYGRFTFHGRRDTDAVIPPPGPGVPKAYYILTGRGIICEGGR
jgi:hypothetical protein